MGFPGDLCPASMLAQVYFQFLNILPNFFSSSTGQVGTNYLHHCYWKYKCPPHPFFRQNFLCLVYVSYYFRDIRYMKRNKQISVLKELQASSGRFLAFSLSMSQRLGHLLMLLCREHGNPEGSCEHAVCWIVSCRTN